MKHPIVVGGLMALAALATACTAGSSTAWCSLDWPGSDKPSIAGDCRIDQDPGEEGATSVEFHSHNASFVFPNANRGVNFERLDSDDSMQFKHNDYVLTVAMEGRPDDR